MKIIYENSKLVGRFDYLAIGQVFKYKNEYYLKVINEKYANSVSLENNKVWFFNSNCQVEVINAEIVIKG